MAVYNKPPISNIPFSFSSTGYSPPAFGSIPFSFKPGYEQMANLRSAINVMGLYQNTTYTYLKRCPKIVVGYTAYGIQTLQLPCEYGGIRDIGGYIHGNPPHVDLGSHIFALAHSVNLQGYITPIIPATTDLRNIIKLWHRSITSDLKSIIKGWSIENTFDLSAYIKSTFIDTKDLGVYLKQTTQDYANLLSILKGKYYEYPVDLPAAVKLWFREQQLNLPVYIKQTYTSYLDIISRIRSFTATMTDLPAYIHSWQEEDLGGYIQTMQYLNLGSIIGTQDIKNLNAYLNTIQPINLQSIIHAWHIFDLPSYLIGVYGPGDIQSSITPVPAVVLRSYIAGFKGIEIPFDLRARIESYFAKNLTSIISPIAAKDLSSLLTVVGASDDIPGVLYPKIIYVKRFMPVSLLEHKDLMGLINIACFGTGYKDLVSYLVPKTMKNLRSAIFGVYGNNIVNLGSTINTGEIETADTLPIKSHSYRKMTEIPITFNMRNAPYTYDTLYIRYGNHASYVLNSIIQGVPTYTDLSSSVTAIINADFTLLSDVSQTKHREIVVNLMPGEPQWQREVELAFRQSVHDYYYFSGNSTVYRTDRNKKWSLRVEGFERITDGTVDRGKIRTKYLFSLSDYATIDEGVRDLIDRVSMFRRVDLAANIISGGGYRNLHSYINTMGYTLKSNKTLGSLLTGITSHMYDISANITGVT